MRILALLLLLGLPARDDVSEFVAAIDAAVRAIPGFKVPAGLERVDDAAFLRRVMKDLVDEEPPGEDVQRFAADPAADKRDAKIRELLATRRWAEVWARRFAEVFFGDLRSPRMEVPGLAEADKVRIAERFVEWLAQALADDRPWNEIAADLVLALGGVDETPALGFKLSAARPGNAPVEFAVALSRNLLGVRLRCATCHDHPFDRWTVEDAYAMAAFAARQEIIVAGGRVEVRQGGNGEVRIPGKGVITPKFLFGGAGPVEGDRLLVLAGYLALPANTQTPRMLANRAWEWLFGRGLVHPVDDFNLKNKPLSPVLQQALVKDLVDHRQSLKRLLRGILNTQVYQLPEIAPEFADGPRLLRGAVLRGSGTPKVPKDMIAFDVPKGWTLADSRVGNEARYLVPAKGKGRRAELFVGSGGVRTAKALIETLGRQAGGAHAVEEAFEGKSRGTLLELNGTMTCDPAYEDAPAFRALFGVVEAGGGWIFRLEGPNATVSEWREEFLSLLKSLPK